MKLSQGFIKEQNNYNLALSKIDENNNIVRAIDPVTGGRFNALDRESVIMGTVSLLREVQVTPTTSGVHIFFVTCFPIQLDIARKIQKNPAWVPIVVFKPKTVTNVSATSSNPQSANTQVHIVNLTGQGVGSGDGVVTNQPPTINPAVPVKQQPDQSFSLQIPQNNVTNFQVNALPLNSYGVFQVALIGNQRNIYPITLTGNRTIMDFDIPVLSASP